MKREYIDAHKKQIEDLEKEIEQLKKSNEVTDNLSNLKVHTNHSIDDLHKPNVHNIETWYTRNGKEVIVIDKELGYSIPTGNYELVTKNGCYKINKDIFNYCKEKTDLNQKLKEEIEQLKKNSKKNEDPREVFANYRLDGSVIYTRNGKYVVVLEKTNAIYLHQLIENISKIMDDSIKEKR